MRENNGGYKKNRGIFFPLPATPPSRKFWIPKKISPPFSREIRRRKVAKKKRKVSNVKDKKIVAQSLAKKKQQPRSIFPVFEKVGKSFCQTGCCAAVAAVAVGRDREEEGRVTSEATRGDFPLRWKEEAISHFFVQKKFWVNKLWKEVNRDFSP